MQNIKKDRGLCEVQDSEVVRDHYNEYYSSGDRHSQYTHSAIAAKAVATGVISQFKKLGISLPSNASFLDVGCAKGYISNAFAKIGYKVTGIDYAEVALEDARKLFPDISFVHMDGFNPTCEPESYDGILLRGFPGFVTRDFDEVRRLAAVYYSFIKEGGCLIIAVTTDLSGEANSTNGHDNWTIEECKMVAESVGGEYKGYSFESKSSLLGMVKATIKKLIRKSTPKQVVYTYVCKPKV